MLEQDFAVIEKRKWGNNDEEDLDSREELKASLSDEECKYPMYNIKVEKGFYTVFELKRKYDNANRRIVLDSDFQRSDVWTLTQKAELVESIFMGLPLPIFYFNQDKLGRLIVVDGRQRLTALFEFMSDKWALKGLKVLKELNGKKFSDFEPLLQSQIEDYQIQAHVIQPPTPDRIKFDIFDRVNRAGTQLNKQEIRNALYQGKSTKLLKDIAKTEIFKTATDKAFVNSTRMKDKYIVLRFLAFKFYLDSKEKIFGRDYKYTDDIDELLGLTMEKINEMADEKIAQIYQYTVRALENTVEIIGENAFRLEYVNGKRSPINMNVFEVLMYMMSKIERTDYVTQLVLQEKIQFLKKDVNFLDAIGNHRDNSKKVEKRFEMVNAILEECGL